MGGSVPVMDRIMIHRDELEKVRRQIIWLCPHIYFLVIQELKLVNNKYYSLLNTFFKIL